MSHTLQFVVVVRKTQLTSQVNNRDLMTTPKVLAN